jgi:hypothetical protein
MKSANLSSFLAQFNTLFLVKKQSKLTIMNLHKHVATLSHSKQTQFLKTLKLLLLKLKNYFAQRHNEIPAQVSNKILALLESQSFTCSAIGKRKKFLQLSFDF